MGGMFHADGALGLGSYPAVNSYTAISAEAGIASRANNQSYSATAACMNIFNQSSDDEGGRRVIIPRKLELIAQDGNDNGTDIRLHFYRDNIDRWSSGGTELTPYPLAGSENDDFVQIAAKAKIYVGDLTLATAGSLERCLWRTIAKNEILVENDKITVLWGASGENSVVAASEFTVVTVPPMWIGPGKNLSIRDVGAAQTVDPQWQYNFWWEEIETSA